MNISENILYITEKTTQWEFFRNKSYTALIQLADGETEYNVKGKKGVVYNILENSYENVAGAAAVVTGVAGEMWPIGQSALKKYKIAPENITAEPQKVDTVEVDTVFAGVRIPADTEFTLEVDYGEKAVLNGNRQGISHGEGDYVLVLAKAADGKLVPDFSDSGRIVNGEIFDKLYKKI